MPDNKRDVDADYWIRNNTKSDFVFGISETDTKEVVRKQIVQTGDGQEIWDVEDEVEVKKTTEQIHLPPTVDQKDPGRVCVTEDEMDQIREETNFDDMVDDYNFDVSGYNG